MATTLTRADFVRMIHAAAAAIRENCDELSRLDAAIGDGDHGTSMLRAVEAASKAADAAQGDFKALCTKVAWDVMGIDGGSTGPLLGSLFMGMAPAGAGTEELEPAAVASMFEAGLAKLLKQSKAQVGDKTMVDALVPAVEALKANADKGLAAMFEAAAACAAAGAGSTKDFVARFGRARNLGDRVIGHPDPGATSIAYIFGGFAGSLKA